MLYQEYRGPWFETPLAIVLAVALFVFLYRQQGLRSPLRAACFACLGAALLQAAAFTMVPSILLSKPAVYLLWLTVAWGLLSYMTGFHDTPRWDLLSAGIAFGLICLIVQAGGAHT